MLKPDDAFDLARFVFAQSSVFDAVLRELEDGRKQTHWMWFVFPQLRGLGRSSTARFYGLESLAEARAYTRHALLGPRLVQCTRRVLAHDDRSLHAIFGSPDDLKFHSSMSLFSLAADGKASVFQAALDRFRHGTPDAQTLALLDRDGRGPA